MTPKGVVTMVAVMAFVWGGLAFFLATAISKERRKRAHDSTGSS